MNVRGVFAAALIFGMVVESLGSPFNYAQRSVRIRAGVVVLDAQLFGPVPANYNPYVWFNLDSNRNVKPAGWTFLNPSAPTQVTPAIQARWQAINAARGEPGIVPVIGAPLTKRDAAYWEVFLSQVSDEQLSQFDALHVSAHGTVSLNPSEREKLRKFMEHGGMLWVDLASTTFIDLINGFPLPFNVSSASTGQPLLADYFHPLLMTPSNVNAASLIAMQSEQAIGLTDVNLTAAGFPQLADLQQTTESDFRQFYHLALDNLGPFISLGRVGDGTMIVTTRGVATTLNRTQRLVGGQAIPGTYLPNNLSVAEEPLFDRTSDAAARLVVNMAHLAGSFEQGAKGARRTGGGPIDIGAPLLKRFDAPIPFGANYFVSPVVYKGLVFVTHQDRILAYDANPSRDLDNDGNPDDGVADLATGSDYDLVWTSEALPGPISGPTAAEVPASSVRDQVAVVDASGRVCVFDAFPGTSVNVAPVFVDGPPPSFAAPSGRPHAPTFYDGLYFVADEALSGVAGVVGRVWVFDAVQGQMLRTGGTAWAIGGPGVSVMRPASASPTVGAIPIGDNSGGVDRVVYVPTNPNPFGGPTQTAAVTSIWFGAKGEKPQSFTEIGNQLIVVTRASVQGLRVFTPAGPHPLGIKLTVVAGNGAALDAPSMDALFTGAVTENNGVLTFTFEPGQNLPANASIRVDYTIDWGSGVAAMGLQTVRATVTFPDDLNRRRRVLGQVALSPEGTLHVVTADPDPASTGPNGHDGGTYWALREITRGTFRIVNRYDLYQAHSYGLSQVPIVQYAEALFDTDEVQTLMPVFLSGPLQRLRFRSGPVVQNGFAYVTATGTKTIGVPCAIVMAFEAEPEVPQILVPDVSGDFSIVQPDLARSDNKTSPNVFTVIQGNQFTYDGARPGGKGTIRMNSLSPNQRGALVNTLSRNLPIVIRRSGQPDIVIEPDRTGSRWSPLEWYIVFHGYDNRSAPLVTGNTLFIASSSRLPSILRGDPFPFQEVAVMLGMDSVISPTDIFLRSNPNRPWLKQLWQIDRDVPGPGDILPNPDIRWPQSRGVRTFDEWRQRLMQTTLVGPTGSSSSAFGAVGGDGVLLAWSEIGLWAFSRADFFVADEGRLARFDSSGNPVWTSDATVATGIAADSGAAGDVKPLVRPTRAYPVNAREMLVVDTAGDRVVVLDTSGRELRSIDRFRLDPGPAGGTPPTPDGYKTNDPLTLRQPRDVFVYTTYVANPTWYSNSAPLEFWVRFLIADAGNRRLVEVIDRYAADPVTRQILNVIVDGSGERAMGILNWHSPSSVSGKNFQYSGLAATFDAVTGLNPRRLYAACIGSALPTRVGLGLDTPSSGAPAESQEGNGGIVLFDDQGVFQEVINEVEITNGIPAGVFWDPAALSWSSAPVQPRVKRLGNIRSVTMRFVLDSTLGPPTPRLAIMFTDAEGVFEIVKPPSSARWIVRWMLPKTAYRYIRRDLADVPTNANPLDFLPTYARRLDSGEIIVVNGYVGRTGAGNFSGEVLQLDGLIDPTGDPAVPGFWWTKRNLGFDPFSITFQLPPVQGARGIVMPVFADRR